jgi:hypothetical protein
MLSIPHLEQAVQAYLSREVSLNQFVDWLEDASLVPSDSQQVAQVCMLIDAALDELRQQRISRTRFDEELAAAIRPLSSKLSDRLTVLPVKIQDDSEVYFVLPMSRVLSGNSNAHVPLSAASPSGDFRSVNPLGRNVVVPLLYAESGNSNMYVPPIASGRKSSSPSSTIPEFVRLRALAS